MFPGEKKGAVVLRKLLYENEIESASDAYRLLGKLGDFFQQIAEIAPEFEYVCARERRCFNLVARFLPSLDMISTRALSLQYRQIADFYQKNNRMPRILILDDILIHGRSLAKHISQLEQTISNELQSRGIIKETDSSAYSFHRSFVDAVTIFVYARNKGVIFLDDSLMRNVKSVMQLYAGQLRDLSLQMAEKLSQWEIANTSYVYSIRCEAVTSHLEKMQCDGQIKDTQWVRYTWEYANETMILYIRFHGKDVVNRADTIRFFPDRHDMLSPQITSFSIFGDISSDAMGRIFQDVQSVCRKYGLKEIENLLYQPKEVKIRDAVLQCQAQMVSLILSIVTLFDFCKDVVPESILAKNTFRGDLFKIASNFGKRDVVLPELMQIVASRQICRALADAITPVIRDEADKLLGVSPDVYKQVKLPNAIRYERYNQLIKSVIYRVGMESEKSAYELNMEPYCFIPENFQEFEDGYGIYGRDGVVTLRQLSKIGERMRRGRFRDEVYAFLAAFIIHMDNSVVSVRMKTARDIHGMVRVSTMAKAGEMASFYLPQRLSLFVPAFARIEDRCFGDQDARKAAVLQFIENRIMPYFADGSQKLRNFCMNDERKIEAIKAAADPLHKDIHHVKEEIVLLYSVGQSFRGWNFPNLVRQRMKDPDKPKKYKENTPCTEFQEHLIDEADDFIEEYYTQRIRKGRGDNL